MEGLASAIDRWGARVLKGRFLQQFAALYYKNGERGWTLS